MQPVLLVIQFLLAVALVAVIMLQRTAQDGGGLMGGGNTMGGLFTARGSANLLTRATGILATLFIINSLALGFLASHAHQSDALGSQMNLPAKSAPAAPVPATSAPTSPAQNQTPKAPSPAPEVPMAH